MPPLPGDRRSGSRRAITAIAIFAGLVGLYQANGVAIPGGDTVPHRYLPLSVLCERDLDLDEIPLRIRRNGQVYQPYYLVEGEGGHQYSTFGFLPGLLATPVFWVAKLRDAAFDYQRVLDLGKWAATIWVALSGVFVWATARARTEASNALRVALVYGVATSAWSVASQSLWQHSVTLPLLAAALACLCADGDRGRHVPWAGLLLGLATLGRPTNVFVAMVFTSWVYFQRRHRLAAYVALASLPAAAGLLYGQFAFGDPLATGQGLIAGAVATWKTGSATPWASSAGDVLEGVTGVLLSPSRGLFVFSPILLAGAAGLLSSFRRGGDALLRHATIATGAIVLVHGLRFDWWGGWTWGYRLVLDALPLLALGLGPALEATRSRPAARFPVLLALAFSVWVQVLGAFTYDPASWNAHPDVDHNPGRLWSWSEGQLTDALLHPRIRTSIDGIDTPAPAVTVCPVVPVPPT